MNIIIVVIAIACWGVIGFYTGYYFREIRGTLIKLTKFQEEQRPEVGPTPGLYHPANENRVNTDTKVGVVTPKSPQLLEFEEQQRINKMNKTSI